MKKALQLQEDHEILTEAFHVLQSAAQGYDSSDPDRAATYYRVAGDLGAVISRIRDEFREEKEKPYRKAIDVGLTFLFDRGFIPAKILVDGEVIDVTAWSRRAVVDWLLVFEMSTVVLRGEEGARQMRLLVILGNSPEETFADCGATADLHPVFDEMLNHLSYVFLGE